MAVRILHTADWQIGRAFSRFPQEAAVSLQEQRIKTIKKIASLARERDVDAVLVAGDVFEFETMSERTLHQVVNATAAYAGPWLLLPGNHDPATEEGVWSQLRRLDGLPSNIVPMDKPEPYAIAGGKAVVLPAPLQRKHEAIDITAWFDGYAGESDTIRIGLAHGSLDNRLPERGEAPNTINDRRAELAKLDYLALGDWHGTLNVAKKTWYSGTHETDRFRDNDSGNVLMVTIETHGSDPVVEKIPVGFYRWHQIAPAVGSDSPAEEIDQALKACGEPVESLVVQLAPRGHASLEERTAIDKLLTKWSALVRHIELVDEQLVSQAQESDLKQLSDEGFIQDAVSKLRELSGTPDNPDREVADLALQLLYTEYKLLAVKR
jgi:DNA repair exonuclease SbcCD nuclease subunit